MSLELSPYGALKLELEKPHALLILVKKCVRIMCFKNNCNLRTSLGGKLCPNGGCRLNVIELHPFINL
jgi:hypothetical protein